MTDPTGSRVLPRRLCIDGRFLLQDVTGVQRVAIEFVRALDEMLDEGEVAGTEVELLVPARGALVTDLPLRAVRLRRVGRLGSHAWEQLELPVLVGRDPVLCLGNVAPLALLLSGRAPVYTMVHDLSYAYFPQAYSRSFRAVYRALVPTALARSRMVFTVSQSERSAILARYPRLVGPDRLVAVQNGGGEGAATARATADPASLAAGAEDVPTVGLRDRSCLYVGSLTRRKNAGNLVRAAVELVRGCDVDVVFVGATGASFESTGVEVPDDVAPRIHFLGQVNDPARIEAEYRRASVFLFPSHYEASPLPPVEAMRFGCPVVAGDIPSLRERCGDAVAYCDPRQVGSIVAAAAGLLTDTEEWQRLQHAGLQQAAGHSWRGQVRAVLDQVAATRD